MQGSRIILAVFLVAAAMTMSGSALASAQNVLNVIGPLSATPFDSNKVVEFGNALCEDAEQTRERTPPFTNEMKEKLHRERVALPPLGTEGFNRGVMAMSNSKEVALETINIVVSAVRLECDRTSNPDFRFWINVATALSDETFDQAVTTLQNIYGIDLRKPWETTTAMFIARQLLLEIILRRIVKPQITSVAH